MDQYTSNLKRILMSQYPQQGKPAVCPSGLWFRSIQKMLTSSGLLLLRSWRHKLEILVRAGTRIIEKLSSASPNRFETHRAAECRHTSTIAFLKLHSWSCNDTPKGLLQWVRSSEQNSHLLTCCIYFSLCRSIGTITFVSFRSVSGLPLCTGSGYFKLNRAQPHT
jgi:hypothetical protein